jgi:outer membrane protein assembly factor BamB
VSPDSTLVFVTGLTVGTNLSSDYAGVAYDSATGQRLWSARYDGTAGGDDEGDSVVVSADGATVFVTGGSHGASFGPDYATVAYDATNGHRLWSARYDGPDNFDDVAVSAAVSLDGARVFVTGQSTGTASGYDYATLAYDTSTGHRLRHHRLPGLI